MQLVVHVDGRGQNLGVTRFELNTFADQDKVAARIARAIRNWIRVVPVRAGGSRLDVKLTAEWLEPSVAKIPMEVAKGIVTKHMKRQRKARK